MEPAASETGLARQSSWGPQTFPVGLRVLVVDDDPTCLMIVAGMLRKCNYEVTTSINGLNALSLLRSQPNHFDLVLSDVVMPDMDGFKLLEHIGLELDLPVIMMSGNGETNTVLRGVTHGAVDFLIKPVRIEELRNVWQHVVRRKRTSSAPEGGLEGGAEEVAFQEGDDDDEEEATQPADHKRKSTELSADKRQRSGDSDGEGEGDGAGCHAKKARVVWSVEMHQQFVNAVNTLGVDKAVPKRILDLMNVEGLTRENVASHLQKYRLYLKRVQGVQSASHGVEGGDINMHHMRTGIVPPHPGYPSDMGMFDQGSDHRHVRKMMAPILPPLGMSPRQSPSLGLSSGIPGVRLHPGTIPSPHEAGPVQVLGAGALSGFGNVGAELGAELSYGPPPVISAQEGGLEASYGIPPAGSTVHMTLGGGSSNGLGYGVPSAIPPGRGYRSGSIDYTSMYEAAGVGGQLRGYNPAATDFGVPQDPYPPVCTGPLRSGSLPLSAGAMLSSPHLTKQQDQQHQLQHQLQHQADSYFPQHPGPHQLPDSYYRDGSENGGIMAGSAIRHHLQSPLGQPLHLQGLGSDGCDSGHVVGEDLIDGVEAEDNMDDILNMFLKDGS